MKYLILLNYVAHVCLILHTLFWRIFEPSNPSGALLVVVELYKLFLILKLLPPTCGVAVKYKTPVWLYMEYRTTNPEYRTQNRYFGMVKHRRAYLEQVKWQNNEHNEHKSKRSGFDLTTHVSYFMILLEVFMNHILAECTYFTNHMEWTEHIIMVAKFVNRNQII